jgi:O-methyltransferase involved in polyketide biosynthesis
VTAVKKAIALGAVEETMLLTLYGRALATRSGNGLLCDPRAVEMVETIDYNFRRFGDDARLFGSVLRTRILDEMIRLFLTRVPSAMVVEIGAGLNTRFERVDNGTVRWVDLDLPDAMRVRRRFFAETARRRMVAASVLDPSWTGLVKQSGGPYFLVAEGVFGYLPEHEVKKALALISEQLPGTVIVFDAASSRGMDAVRDRPVWPGLRARLAWRCDDPREVEGWGLGYRLLESRSLDELPPALERTIPFSYRCAMDLARVLGWDIDAYRLNVYGHSALAAKAQPGFRKSRYDKGSHSAHAIRHAQVLSAACGAPYTSRRPTARITWTRA